MLICIGDGKRDSLINYATLKVPVSGRYLKGGGALVNENVGTVDCCVNYGTLVGCWIGGIAYYTHKNSYENPMGSLISNCYNAGEYHKVEISNWAWQYKDERSVNGIVYDIYDDAVVSNCIFSGRVIGDFKSTGTFVIQPYTDKDVRNCYYYGDYNDKYASKLSTYDLTSQDFVDTLNLYAQRDVWCVDSGRVKLAMEVNGENASVSPYFILKTSFVQSDEVTVDGKIVGCNIKESGVEWKEVNASEWNRRASNQIHNVSTVLTELAPLHIYSIRLYAVDEGGTMRTSDEQAFATLYEDVTNTNDTLYIDNLYSLKAFAMTVEDNTYLDKVVMLSNDIDMLGNKGVLWEPIQGSFRGVLDGNGYTLRNMKVDAKYNAGLFSRTDYCRIRNLGIVDADIKGWKGAGGFVTWGWACFENCMFKGKITMSNYCKDVGYQLPLSPFGNSRQCVNCYSFADLYAPYSVSLKYNSICGLVSELMTFDNNRYPKSILSSSYCVSTGKQYVDVIRNIDLSLSDFSKCYMQGLACDGRTTLGTCLNESEMKDGTLLQGLDSDAWAPDDEVNPINNGYPVLKWQLRNSRVATQDVMWDERSKVHFIGTYIPGIDRQYTRFGFEWIEKKANQAQSNFVMAEDAKSFEIVLDGFHTQDVNYYRAFAATEENDTIFGDWVEFEKMNGNPVPYIDNFVQLETEGTAKFNPSLIFNCPFFLLSSTLRFSFAALCTTNFSRF